MNFYQILKEHFGLDSERKALYRKVDWVAMGLTFLIGHRLSDNAGSRPDTWEWRRTGSQFLLRRVPHPPGYPV